MERRLETQDMHSHDHSDSDSDESIIPQHLTRRTNAWRHPELTGYRILVILLTFLFGLSKAILAYKGQSLAGNSVEWVFGVVCSLALYWLGLYEKRPPPPLRWMFKRNYAPYIKSKWPIFKFLSLVTIVTLFAIFYFLPLLVYIFSPPNTPMEPYLYYLSLIVVIGPHVLLYGGFGVYICILTVRGVRWFFFESLFVIRWGDAL
ncbi:hypothetical protein BD410DRAFT_140117 [Rickenella mellea]|uniref:Transmembrane protein n=1 Tax=Rickenella mellea TaxID=50990 RepID=A0A4Y7PKV3_9AGAM|nr:hypothetical protein BD410DRAFT_140117 [Rickenella mellea]